MTDKELEQQQEPEMVTSNDINLDAIKTLKDNSVSKETYNQLADNYKKLMESYVNGDKPQQEVEKPIASRADLLKIYEQNEFASDLDFWANFLQLRDATIREYGKDPCVTGNYGVDPNGDKVQAAYGEAEAIAEQMEIMQGLVEQADGDPQVFQLLLSQNSR